MVLARVARALAAALFLCSVPLSVAARDLDGAPAPRAISIDIPLGKGAAGATDGEFIIVEYCCDDPLYHNQIAALRIDDGSRIDVAVGPENEYNAQISDGVVVWLAYTINPAGPNSDLNIKGKALATGEEFVVADGPDDEHAVRISGKWVIWQQSPVGGGAWTTMARDISTLQPAFAIPAASTQGHSVPEISGNRVVWWDPATSAWLMVRLGESLQPEQIALAEQPNDIDLDASGDTLVWTKRGSLMAADIETGEVLVILPETDGLGAFGPPGSPTTNGRYVFWVRVARAGGLLFEGFDTTTLSMFPIQFYPFDEQHPSNMRFPRARGDILVWTEGLDSGTTIRVRSIAAILPTAPRPDLYPGATCPSYFSETGHAISCEFQEFWQDNGGLPIFGYPLTEPFSEREPATGSDRTVQYTERQRFEAHPELAGTPYAVLLGRLGADDAAAQGLRNTPAFQPAAALDGCISVPETGHNVCGRFQDYWQAHGLEFGDAGVTFRESLALFGYPLSEEFNDPETGLTTQYFERAVFEYHPDNPAEYQVLLRRLGAEALVRRGW